MSTARTPLLFVLAALVGLSLLTGSGIAIGSDSTQRVEDGATGSLDTPTATPIDENTTATPIATVSDETADLDEPGTSTSNQTDSRAALGVNGSFDGYLDADGIVGVDADTSVEASVETAETPSPAAADGETPTATAVAGEPAPSDGTGGAGVPPVDPLVGGVVLGGAAATGLAGRALLTGAETPGLAEAGGRARRTFSTAVAGWPDRLTPLLGLFGYLRYDDSDPLEHAGRERLYECVRSTPGIHLSALSESADLPLSTARYHLRVLEHEGLVRSGKLRGKRRYFPLDVEAEALAAALTDEAPANVLRSLVREGPASVTSLAERLGRDPSTVSHHLDRLEADGLVERERRGRAVVSRPTPAVEAAVGEVPALDAGVVEPGSVASSD